MTSDEHADILAQIPSNIDISKPNVARMYDYLLGGFYNFEADRQLIEQILQVHPDARKDAFVNRRVLQRMVTFMAEAGITQFLDIGAGIPTVQHTHEVAQEINPDSRVVYVDIDPIAVTHAKTLLQNNPNTDVFQADTADIELILNHPVTQSLLDFQKPIGVLLISVLHYVTDDEVAYHVLDAIKAAIPSDSYVAVIHSTLDGYKPTSAEESDRLLKLASAARHRDKVDIAKFFEGLKVVEPGMVYSPRWRPESKEDLFYDEPWRAFGYGGVGRKP